MSVVQPVRQVHNVVYIVNIEIHLRGFWAILRKLGAGHRAGQFHNVWAAMVSPKSSSPSLSSQERLLMVRLHITPIPNSVNREVFFALVNYNFWAMINGYDHDNDPPDTSETPLDSKNPPENSWDPLETLRLWWQRSLTLLYKTAIVQLRCLRSKRSLGSKSRMCSYFFLHSGMGLTNYLATLSSSSFKSFILRSNLGSFWSIRSSRDPIILNNQHQYNSAQPLFRCMIYLYV